MTAHPNEMAAGFLSTFFRPTDTITVAWAKPFAKDNGKVGHKDFAQRRFSIADTEAIVQWAAHKDVHGNDVWFTPAPRTPDTEGRTKATTAPAEVVWADVDTGATESVSAFLADSKATVVASGGTYTDESTGEMRPRIHVYYRLRSLQSPLVIEYLNRALAAKVGGDAKWSSDSLLRLPGTRNHKAAAFGGWDAALVTVLQSPEKEYEVAELAALLGVADPSTLSKEELENSTASTNSDWSGEVEEIEGRLPGHIHRRVVEFPIQGSRSEQRLQVIRCGVEWGYTVGQILGLLSEHAPTQEKYGPDRYISYSLADIEMHRDAHQHQGKNCAEAGCPNMPEWMKNSENDLMDITIDDAALAKVIDGSDTETTKKASKARAQRAELAAARQAELPELPNPAEPYQVAKKVKQNWTFQGKSTLAHWRDDWLVWTGTCWKMLSANEMASKLYTITGDAYWVKENKDGPVKQNWAPNRAKIGDLSHALMSQVILPREVESGTWLNRQGETPLMISCTNGLVDTEARKLFPHDPEFFTMTSLPFDYAPDAECPQWEEFLASVWGDDPESVAALQEWFGYVISGRTDLQKMVQLIGAKRSGKGTISRVLSALVGRANVSGQTLNGLTTNFGLAPLVGKSLAVIGDARLSGRGTGEIVERLLSISGEDELTVDRKHREAWTGRISARVMILSNEMVNFGDASAALPSRFMTLVMRKSFFGKEDTTLADRLLGELDGIFNWALDGLKRLDERGRFVQPESGKEMAELQVATASPFTAFLNEMCVIDEDAFVEVNAIRDAWNTWCMLNNRGNDFETPESFARKLYAAAPSVTKKQKKLGGKKCRVWAGVGLKVEKADEA